MFVISQIVVQLAPQNRVKQKTKCNNYYLLHKNVSYELNINKFNS